MASARGRDVFSCLVRVRVREVQYRLQVRNGVSKGQICVQLSIVGVREREVQYRLQVRNGVSKGLRCVQLSSYVESEKERYSTDCRCEMASARG
jgi:hypothetical protein